MLGGRPHWALLEDMKEILLNRMYVGRFLENNIGHEVINLFKDDNGSNYIYINPYGQLDRKHNEIESILLVRGINATTVEIIAKAVDLTPILDNALPRNTANKIQRNYIRENKVTYDGVLLDDIYYQNESTNEVTTVYISFKAENIFYPKQKIFLTTNEKSNYTEKAFLLPETTFPKQALHWTYSVDSKAYSVLSSVIEEPSLWENKNRTQRISEITTASAEKDFNFLKLIRKEYDELCYSNMFQYFLADDKELFKDFMSEVLGLSTKGKYSIQRETEHIDLLIQDDENIVVIENKIKSGINGLRHDIYGDLVQSQLLDYHKYADEHARNRKEFFYIFAPNYNRIDLRNYEKSEDYKIINYSVLYDFFSKHKSDNKYYDDFLSALKIHAKEIDNSNFEIMQERFIETINSVK